MREVSQWLSTTERAARWTRFSTPTFLSMALSKPWICYSSRTVVRQPFVSDAPRHPLHVQHFALLREGALGARLRGHRLRGAGAAAGTAPTGYAPNRSAHPCAGARTRWSVRAGVECDHRL